MEKKKLNEWVMEPKPKEILISFSTPKTQSQIIKKHAITKYHLQRFLKQKLIKCLNPELYEGKLYVLTRRARNLLGISTLKKQENKNYELIGWILASPRQRLIVLR